MEKNFEKTQQRLKNLLELRRKLANALTDDAVKLREVLEGIIADAEASAEEFNAEGLAEEIEKAIRENLNKDVDERVTQEVANAIAKKVANMQQALTPAAKQKLDVKVQNQISAAILRCTGKEYVKNAVEEVLVKNAITGLTFEEVVDYSIVDNWGDGNPIFKLLKKVPFTKFFYTTEELTNTAVQAKQFNSRNLVEKTIQQIETQPKTISTDYIYKIQEVAFKDLDSLEKAGRLSLLLRWLNEELDRQIINTILLHILVGGNATGITTFESIGGKAATDAFTIVSSLTAANFTLANVATEVAKINRKAGDKVIAVMSAARLLALQKFTYAAGGTEEVRSREYVAASIGVDEIHTATWMGDKVVVFVPGEYWYVEDNALSVAYPVYLNNKQNFQKERNIGGAVHGLLSSLVINIGE
jgi:hypothetical protein